MENGDELIRIFSINIRDILRQVKVAWGQVQELRLRVNAPLFMVCGYAQWFVTPKGGLSDQREKGYMVTKEDLRETMEHMSNYSLYAFEEEIRQGFLTIQGGHRIGLAGKTVVDQKGIKTIKFISFLNVRLAHQVKGCASPVLPYLYEKGQVLHTLIISPPKCGKTTLLRDLIRQISDGSDRHPGVTVGVVDERSELAACYQGVPQNDMGIRTDILDCCPKAEGMMMLIRTMSPEVVAVDEIGGQSELEAMDYVMNCGCKILATIHGSSLEDVRQKPVMSRLFRDQVFKRYVVLNQQIESGNIEAIFDGTGKVLWRERRPAYGT